MERKVVPHAASGNITSGCYVTRASYTSNDICTPHIVALLHSRSCHIPIYITPLYVYIYVCVERARDRERGKPSFGRVRLKKVFRGVDYPFRMFSKQSVCLFRDKLQKLGMCLNSPGVVLITHRYLPELLTLTICLTFNRVTWLSSY